MEAGSIYYEVYVPNGFPEICGYICPNCWGLMECALATYLKKVRHKLGQNKNGKSKTK